MKGRLRILALLLSLTMIFSLTACVEKKTPTETSGTEATTTPEATTPDPVKDQTLVVGYSNFSEKFSPFFASSAYDVDVYTMASVALLDFDREGNMLLNGKDGQTITYDGTDHYYNGIANCIITENADGSVVYDFDIRDDIVFSDGKPLTADDVIFNMYVYADPAYDGSATFYALPIRGMADYRSGMAAVWKLIFDDIAAGNDTSASSFYSAADAQNFEKAFKTAGIAFTQEIIDYCVANYSSYAEMATGFTADEVSANVGLQVAMGEYLWGYADGLGDDGLFYDATGKSFDLAAGEYPTVEEYWNMILEAYGYDLSDDGINYESAGTGIIAFIGDTLVADYPELAKSVQTGDSRKYVSGIEKTGDYSVRVTMDSLDATAILQFNFAVAPLHYYGDPSLYNYNQNQFGFPKGDLSKLKSVSSTPIGAGPYKFVSYNNGVVTFEANELYYKGMPKIKYVLFQEVTDADKLTGIATGTLDISDPSISSDVVKSIKDYNGGEMTGDVITTNSVDNLGYGYIGIQADVVSVGGDSGSEASKNLRKAFATVFAAYRDSVIGSYYGERASVIQYPISNTSWAAPKPADEGYQIAYSRDVDGNLIYTDNMTDSQKFDAALNAAVGYLKAAGFTFNDETGKFTKAPQGASLAYEFMIPADGTGDHPAFGIVTAASSALATIGIDLQINDLSNSSVLWTALDAGTCAMWAAAWQATPDPDMYQVYSSDNAVGHGGTDSNYYGINDLTLDELILAARATTDQSFRKATYKECLEIVMDWAVEVPTYQRQNVILFSTERINISTLTPDITTYWGWMHDLETLEMN